MVVAVGVDMSHEAAAVGRIAAEEIEYLMAQMAQGLKLKAYTA